MITNSIGQTIRKYRQEKNLSQDELAKLSGLSYNTIVKLERPNKIANPTADTIKLLAKVLEISVQELLFPEA